jgi:transcriptional regulator with XRE-family HTH domain
MNFGERLRELRKQAGMTQEKLARAADVSNATVFKLETVEGQDPSWSTVCKLADALGIGVGDFREQVPGEQATAPAAELTGRRPTDANLARSYAKAQAEQDGAMAKRRRKGGAK